MKKSLFAIVPVLTLVAVGCEEKSPTPAPAKAPTPPKTTAPAPAPTGAAPAPSATNALKDQAAGAAAAASDAATKLRDQAVSAFSTSYDGIKKQIAGLKDKASTVPALAKPAYDSAMTNIDNLTKEADAKLADLKAATGDAVQKAKDALDGVVTKINSAIASAQQAINLK